MNRSSSDYLLSSAVNRSTRSEVHSRKNPILVISGKKTSRVLSNTNLELCATVSDIAQRVPVNHSSRIGHSDNESEDLSSESSWSGEDLEHREAKMSTECLNIVDGGKIFRSSSSELYQQPKINLDLKKKTAYRDWTSSLFRSSAKKSISKEDILLIRD